MSALFSRRHRKRTAVGDLFYVCQVVPLFALGTFSPQIMESLGVTSKLGAGALHNVFLLAGAIVGLLLVDRISRRFFLISTFLVGGCAGHWPVSSGARSRRRRQAATFRAVLGRAAEQFLSGPVTTLYPHLLRHACATHNYERGMGLWEVQKLLGHDRPSTTVTYLATAHADPESVSLAASGRAVQRLHVDQGSLR